MATELTRAAKYASNKAVVRKGMASFVEVGFALMAIRDEQQYLEEYTSWEAFCKGELNQSGRRAYQLISAARFAAEEGKCEPGVHTKTPIRPAKTAATGLNLPTSTEVADSRAPAWAKDEKTTRRAKAVKDRSPKAFKKLKAGKVSLEQAEREAEKPKPDDSVLDGRREPVKRKDLHPIFAAAAGFDEALRGVQKSKRIIDDLIGTPAGECIMQAEWAQVCSSITSAVKRYRPWAECPSCRGAKCDDCEQRGWMTRVEFEKSK